MNNKKPIRIAHVVGKMVGGGVESFIMNYYRKVDKEKVQFDFIIDSDSTVIPKNEIESMGGRIIEVPPYQQIIKYIKALKKIFRENKYEIVYSHLNALSVFPLYCAYKEKIKIRIAHSHSTTNKKEWKKNIIKNILKPFSKVFATDYFACSEHAARWLFGNKLFESGKVSIIQNAIDSKKFIYDESIRKKMRECMNLEEKFVIGHAGRFVTQKNHEFLIDIFFEIYKENKNAILLLIGDGPLENYIKGKVGKLGIKDNVLFLGQRNDVNELMQAMDVFVFPSLYEGLGIVAVEAQCSNLKTVCSNFVPKEVAISQNIMFCELDNILQWKECILKKSENRKDCSKIIKNARFDIESEAKLFQTKLINLYKERV